MPDHHGTDQLAIDAGSQTVTQRRFKPYGEPRGTALPWVNDKGYLHGTADPTGLTHLGAREYDPGIGRFISPDPVLDTANPQQINGYSYCGNSPVTLADPSGLIADIDHNAGGSYQSTTNVDGIPVTHTYDPKTGNTTVTVAGIPVKKYYGTGKGAGADWVVRDPFELAKDLAKQYAAKHESDQALALFNAMSRACVQKDSKAGCDPSFISDLRTAAAMRLAAMNGCVGECFEKQQMAGQAAAQGFTEAGNAGGRLAGGKAPKKGAGFEAEESMKDIAQGKVRPRMCANSFDGQTPVLMADGHAKPIDQVNVGDDLVTTDPLSHATGAHTVVALHRNHDTDLTDLTVTDGRGHVAVLHTTQHHPFWDETANAWVDAGQLRVGDHLYTGTATIETVIGVRSFTGSHDMYNLTVEDVHTYYVLAGTTPALVHNDPDPNIPNVVLRTIDAIDAGDGVIRDNPNGTEDIFRGSGVSDRVKRKWAGSTIYNVPGSRDRYRVLVNGYGDIAYVDIKDGKYQKIQNTGWKIGQLPEGGVGC
jgi:RHS repeat-associated protein